MDYGSEIAKASLDINAIKLQPDEPFIWASGFQMPIYNDNRQLLGDVLHRELVADGLVEMINKSGVTPEFIVGTSTAGIAPATSVANNLGIPLVIFQGEEGHEKPYTFQFLNGAVDTRDYNVLGIDTIASTCPWAIPYAVTAANNEGLPFMYVRPKPKGHGLKKSIEGNIVEGQRAILLDLVPNLEDSYVWEAGKDLAKVGVDAKYISDISQNGLIMDASSFMKGKRGIVIEDLISFGGSSAKEVKMARNYKSHVDHCFSIFSYGLKDADEAFAKLDPGCEYDSLLRYPVLLEVAKEEGYLSEKEIELLKDWREDPKAWGEKNGFPKIEK